MLVFDGIAQILHLGIGVASAASCLQTTMHRGQGWVWEGRGGVGLADGMNELLPQPLPALGEPQPALGQSHI